MNAPFPGMDPYLEHPVLWESIHARLIPAIANQLQPRLDPRYVASIEERVFVEGLQQHISGTATAVVLEVNDLEIHQKRIEILDLNNNMKLVAVIEVVSPTNKTPGPGRESYLDKQREILARDCHLIEIDLLRRGGHVLSIPDWRAQELQPYEYLICVSRWPERNRYHLYSRRLRERLPRIKVPLTEADPDVTLDLQSALEQVYVEGRYLRRIRYEEPCIPPLSAVDQTWANERWAAYQSAHAELFPPPPPPAQ